MALLCELLERNAKKAEGREVREVMDVVHSLSYSRPSYP